TGLALGVWNGLWVAYAGVPSFVVTLGGYLAFRGIAYVLTAGATFSPFHQSFANFFQGFLPITLSIVIMAGIFIVYAGTKGWEARPVGGRPSVRVSANLFLGVIFVAVGCGFFAWAFLVHLGMPVPILVLVVISGVLSFVARRMSFGRHIYAIGG